MNDSYSRLREAILSRRPIAMTYGGHRRFLCPHVLGTKNGRQQVLMYQYGGYHERELAPPGSPDNWRCFAVDRLQDVEILEGPWHTAMEGLRHQVCVDQVDVSVEPLTEQWTENQAAP